MDKGATEKGGSDWEMGVVGEYLRDCVLMEMRGKPDFISFDLNGLQF